MNCRACGAEILFIKTVNGKTTPVNAEPVSVLLESCGKPFLRLDGTTVSGRKIGDAWDDDPDANTVECYESHFATCTAPERFRKARKSERKRADG